MKILFVCLGNICRSPMGETVFRKMAENESIAYQLEIDSAGTANYHTGKLADERMRKHAKRRGYQITSIARQITKDDFENFDMIVAMDMSNYNDLHRICPPEDLYKIVKLTDYCKDYDLEGVPDPYYGGAEGFEYVIDILEDGCSNLLMKIKKDFK